MNFLINIYYYLRSYRNKIYSLFDEPIEDILSVSENNLDNRKKIFAIILAYIFFKYGFDFHEFNETVSFCSYILLC